MHRRVDPHRLVDAVALRRVGVVPARLELDELELVRRVAVDLVRGQEDERRLGHVLAGRLEQVERADRVDLEVVERARSRRGRARAAPRSGRLRSGRSRRTRREDASRSRMSRSWCVKRFVAARSRSRFQVVSPSGAEEVAAHVVVDAVHLQPRASRNATTSEPIRPLEPVTRAVGMRAMLERSTATGRGILAPCEFRPTAAGAARVC